jgi:hypothetical protein
LTTGGYLVQYGAVALLGGATGFGELVSRYKDRPKDAVTNFPGILYLLLNAAASVAALGLILSFDWAFGVKGDALAPTRVLIAGFGSMVFFRSALFKVRVGNADVDVGPSTFLGLVMGACDRAVDRLRGQDRARMAAELMCDVDYRKAEVALPAVALGVMQNLDAADQAALSIQLNTVSSDPDLTDRTKAVLLGLALSNVVGPEVLREAKDVLGKEILREDSCAEQPADPDLAALGLLSGTVEDRS